FPDDPVIAEEDSVELRQPGNAPLLDQVLRYVRAEVGGAAALELTAEEVCRWIDQGGTSQYRRRFWTLDPIDGTKGFPRGEQSAVARALIVEGQGGVAALACPSLVVSGQYSVVSEDAARSFPPSAPPPPPPATGAALPFPPLEKGGPGGVESDAPGAVFF